MREHPNPSKELVAYPQVEAAGVSGGIIDRTVLNIFPLGTAAGRFSKYSHPECVGARVRAVVFNIVLLCLFFFFFLIESIPEPWG